MDPSDSSPDKKIGISVYLAGTGIGVLICTLIFVPDDNDIIGTGGLILVGAGTILGLVESIKEKSAHSCGCIALMLVGLIVFIVIAFLNWIPGPI